MRNSIKCFAVVAMLLMGINSEDAFAKEEKTTIKVNDVSVEVPYSSDNIEVKKQENLNETKVTMKDKKTGKTRVVSEVTNALRTDYNKIMYEEYDCGDGVKVRLYGKFLMYSNGSFHEIKKVEETYWEVSGGEEWELEASHTGWTKMQPNQFEVYGTTNVIRKSEKANWGFIFESFKQLRLPKLKRSSITCCERKLVEGGFAYKI